MKTAISVLFFGLCIFAVANLVGITIQYHNAAATKSEPSQCAQRWAGSGYEARMSGSTCVVKINGKEFPEVNIRVETSAIDIDYE